MEKKYKNDLIDLNQLWKNDLWMSSISKMLSNNNSTDVDRYTTKSTGSPCSTMPVNSKSSIADVQLEWDADMINGLSSINTTRIMLITMLDMAMTDKNLHISIGQ